MAKIPRGRPPDLLETMLQLHLMQNWRPLNVSRPLLVQRQIGDRLLPGTWCSTGDGNKVA